MKRNLGLALLGALLLFPRASQAQDILPRDLNAQETLKFVSGSGVVSSWDNVYVGPYKADVLSGNPTLPGITLYCVDFANGIRTGDVWTVDVTGIGSGASDASSGGTLGNTRLGNNSGSLESYRQAAFLTTLFESWGSYVGTSYSGGTFGNKAQVYSGIHAAIWSIMTGGFPYGFSGINDKALAAAMASPFVQLAVNESLAGFTTMDFNQFSVLTDVVDPGKQEYLVRTSVVPEPETYVLMFSGLLLLGFIARKRLRENGEFLA